MSQVYEWAGPCANCSRAGKIRWSEDRVYDNYCFDCYSLVNDGRLLERERIVGLLQEQARECEKAGLWANGLDLRNQLQELHLGLNAAIALIKGENK